MSSLNVAVLGEDALERVAAAQAFGKKSSSEDLEFYHSVFQGKIINVVNPAAYPKKLSALVQALSLCDFALVLAPSPSPVLGELIIALDLLENKAVFTSGFDLTPFIANTRLRDSRVFASADEARFFLLEQENALVEGGCKIVLDHCFEVKGVGTVALGVVKSGVASVHDELTAFPSGKSVQIKSIQKNDQDVKQASSGDRVGLCLKNVKAEELERGEVLAKSGVSTVKDLKCVASVSKYSKTPIASGSALHLAAGLQFEPVRVECDSEVKPGGSGTIVLKGEKPFALTQGERMLLCDLNAKGPRVIGVASV